MRSPGNGSSRRFVRRCVASLPPHPSIPKRLHLGPILNLFLSVRKLRLTHSEFEKGETGDSSFCKPIFLMCRFNPKANRSYNTRMESPLRTYLTGMSLMVAISFVLWMVPIIKRVGRAAVDPRWRTPPKGLTREASLLAAGAKLSQCEIKRSR